MELSGQWGKAGEHDGKTVWRHESGREIRYDCNAWGWRITDSTRLHPKLWMARCTVEAQAAETTR